MKNYAFTVDLRFITMLLLIVIGLMLFFWKPWDGKAQETISVTGEATVTATPDEFLFMPAYEKKAEASETAIAQASEVGNGVVTKLKEMGVAEKDLKTSVSSHKQFDGQPVPLPAQTPATKEQYVATFQITATVANVETAKKIQAYLATTPVTYTVSPQSSFSKETQKKLESEARTKALADAKKQAQEIASELDVRLGKIVSVSDPQQTGGPIMLRQSAPATAEDKAISSQVTPNFEPGSQDLTFTISVAYKIR